MSTIASPAIDYASAAGPFLMGGLFNWALFGVLSVQVYLYHLAFPRDKWTIKSLVYFVYLTDMTQTCLVTYDIFNAYARHYGNLGVLQSLQLEPIAVPVFSSIVSATVQLYYAHRIGVFFRSQWLQALVSVSALMASVGGLVSAYQALSASALSVVVRKKSISTGIWLAGDAACDIIIAVLMAYLLLKRDSKTSGTRTVGQTHAIIQRIIRLVIETNMLTAIAASTGVVLYYAYPHKAYHRCAATILGKLYSNSMLAILNNRIRIVGGRDWTSDSNVISMDTRGGNFSTVDPIVLTRVTVPTTTYLDGAIHAEREVGTDGGGLDMQPPGSIKKRSDLAAEAV